ncbi:MAG TPA: hypothetical protein VMU87_03000 [Stellaceae bacterium]|nr:hypothetical protein [Stellaceae bacterium]
MSIKGKACIAGVFEHLTRKADDKSPGRLHAECAKGALDIANHLGLRPRHIDSAGRRKRSRAGGAQCVWPRSTIEIAGT